MNNNLKRGFVRGLWGSASNDPLIRNKKLLTDIEDTLKLDNGLDFTCYTYGEENHQLLLSKNIKSVLMDKRPIVIDKWTWCHKLFCHQKAMEDFDETIYLDWDCNKVKELPVNFWENFYKKEAIQGCITIWPERKIKMHKMNPWRRQEEKGFQVNSGFLYMRDKSIPTKLIEEWNKFPDSNNYKLNDETILNFYTDKLMGGWKGLDYWKEHYEPMCCTWTRAGVGVIEKKEEDLIFIHRKKEYK